MYLLSEDLLDVLASENEEAILFADEGTGGPPAPAPVTYNAATGAVSWPAVGGAASYNVYASDGPFAPFVLSGNTASLTYALGEVPEGMWREVRVSSISNSGVEGSPGGAVIALAADRSVL